MKESKKDLLEKYILIDNYIDYINNTLSLDDTLDYMRKTGEFDKMVRNNTISDIKRKIRWRLNISRKGEIAKRLPSVINILDRYNENLERRDKNTKKQKDLLSEKIDKAIKQIQPSHWYKVDRIDDNKITVSVEGDWRYFTIQYYRRNNRVGDCTIDIGTCLFNMYHKTDNDKELTEYAKEQNEAVYKIISAAQYLYNNQSIIEEVCQAMFVYDTEIYRITETYAEIDEAITNDLVAIIEAAARKAYDEGLLHLWK